METEAIHTLCKILNVDHMPSNNFYGLGYIPQVVIAKAYRFKKFTNLNPIILFQTVVAVAAGFIYRVLFIEFSPSSLSR